MLTARRRVFRRLLNLERFEDRLTPATFTVTNLNAEGAGSLRQAVLNSNNSAGADTINFDAALTGTLNINAGLVAPSGIHIDGDGLLINGPGADKLAISGGGLSRIFDTKFSPAGTTITIRNLTLTNGYAKYTSPGTSVDFNGQGGAIFVEDEVVNLDRCVVTGNKSDKSGGGLALGFENVLTGGNGSLGVVSCTISNNQALEGNGGGINVIGEESGGRAQKLYVQNSTISGNTANWTPFDLTYHIGGGIAFTGQVNGATGFSIANSTITNNLGKNGVMGGAIGTLDLNGTMILKNTTISHNQSTVLNTAGIRMENNGASSKGLINMSSTIVANNTNDHGDNSALRDISTHYTTTISGNNNLVGIAASNNIFTGSNNLTGTLANPLSAKLGPLQNNGGPVQTRLPLAGSPVIAAGFANNELFDSRGNGFPRVLDGAADIGATEFEDWVVRNDNSAGPGSLYQRLTDAENYAGANTISFDPVVFNVARTIPWASSVDLREPLTITGPAGNNVTLKASAPVRHLTLDNAPTGTVFAISGLTFSDGNALGNGGSIYASDQVLNFMNCAFMNNSATNGGAVSNEAGTTTFAQCTFSDNSAKSGSGGALFAANSLSVTDCTFDKNTAANGGAIALTKDGQLSVLGSSFSNNSAQASGGAIHLNIANVASFAIHNSTFADNKAAGTTTTQGGGAIFATGTATSALVRSCTFSGNNAQGQGGAVLITSFTGTLNVQNSTIAYNSAAGSFGGGGVARVGGLGGDIVLNSCIVSNNNHTTGSNEDTYSALGVYANSSAIGIPGAGGIYPDSTTLALVGQNFKLGTLANNGGTTLTILPAVDSPIRDNGNNLGGLTLDQRGLPRTWNARTDIGAVELPPNYVVSNSNDAGPGSLRQQILDANTVAGAATITFDSIFFATAKTITMAGTPMTIDQDLTITGPGASLATVDAAKLSRAFTFANGVTATVSGLTLTGGQDIDGAIIQSGTGTLTLNNMSVTANSANGGVRGAIYVAGGSLISNNSTFTGNSGQFGGAIHVDLAGSLVMNSCTVSGNTSANRGGGIYVVGTVSLTGCTISGNVNYSLGGGGLLLNLTAPSSIRNSTISGNSAPINSGTVGGGIYLILGSGMLAIENTTITNNLAGNGGGIARKSGTSSIAVVSSIIEGNSAVTGPDIWTGGTVTLTDSLLGSKSGIGTYNPLGTTAALLGQPAKLGQLANNGGPTMTHALLPGSPAINKGNNLGALTTDQRGGSFGRVVGGVADIGAFESELAPAVSKVSVNQGLVSRSRVLQVDVLFDQVVTFSGAPVSAFQLRRQSDNAVVNLNAVVSNGTGTNVTLTFLAGPAVEFGSLADGRYTLTIDSTKVSAGGNALDGDANGMAGGNYVLVGSPTESSGLFRLFGDADGNGTVTAADFNAFRLAYGNAGASLFDFNGDNTVSAADFNSFRTRYGVTLVP